MIRKSGNTKSRGNRNSTDAMTVVHGPPKKKQKTSSAHAKTSPSRNSKTRSSKIDKSIIELSVCPLRRSSTVVSIDFGRKGMAYCYGRPWANPPLVMSLEVCGDVGISNMPEKVALAMIDFFAKVPRADYYVLEEQPSINRITSMMEAATHVLVSSYTSTIAVYHIPVNYVKKEFDLPNGHDAKKKAAVHVMLDLLGDDRRTALGSPDVVDRVLQDLRIHDMADAFLQFMYVATRKHEKLGKYKIVYSL